MFKSLRSIEGSKINHSARSHVGETMQLEGDLSTSGSIDVAGLINGNLFVSDVTVSNTEADIAIEEIVERKESINHPKPIHVVQQKKAV